jgi:hypothetical protein
MGNSHALDKFRAEGLGGFSESFPPLMLHSYPSLTCGGDRCHPHYRPHFTVSERSAPCSDMFYSTFYYITMTCKGGYTLVTLPRIVTPYRDSVDGNRDRVTYQKLVTR